MSAAVFLGHSFALDRAREILPHAIFHGPAEQGDIIAAVVRDGARAIGFIDGTFRHTQAVWHNELCYALSRGVAIYGGAGMGALRAAETERYGTVGIGEVFQWVRDGIVVRDDDVAHGDVPAHLTLVNIRASMHDAAARGHVDEPTATRVIDLAGGVFYADRSLGTVVAACQGTDIDVAAVERALTSGYVDVQHRDAELLLHRMAADLAPGGHLPEPVPFTFERSASFDALYNLDRRVRHGGVDVPLQMVGEHVAMHDPAYEELRATALDHGIVAFVAGLVGVTVTERDVEDERRRFTDALGLDDDAGVAAWIRSNDLTDTDFDDLVRDQALCQRMRRWMQHTHGLDRGSRLIADEMRRRGHYEQWAVRAAAEHATASAFRGQPEYADLPLADPGDLASAHARATGVRVTGDARIWAEDRGFDDESGLRAALERSAIARDVQDRIARVLPHLTPDN